MFKRRAPLTFLQQIRELLWPSMGWIRAFHYAKHRVLRLSDTSKSIAAGLAIGMAVSFTPIVGTHFVQAGMIAYFARVNILSALIGTFVGNPWTFPFMWWAAISFGSYLFGIIGLPASTALPDEVTLSVMWDIATSDPLRIFLPWLLGGYLMALLMWPFCYLIFYRLVSAAKAAKVRAKARKLKKNAAQITAKH